MYSVNAAADEAVKLTVGRKVYYGTYSTNYFDVDGKTGILSGTFGGYTVLRAL